jgi:hypothetical protein
MSTQDLYDSARAVINQHNDVVGATSPASVDPEEFLENLKIRGYTSEEGLSSMSHEKIAACLPIPISTKEPMLGLAAAIAKAFRKNPEGDTPEAAKSVSGKPYVSSKKAERMTPRELLEHFDPTEPESAAAQRLDKIVNSANFWIPGANSPVDVDLSLKSLEVVKKFGPC